MVVVYGAMAIVIFLSAVVLCIGILVQSATRDGRGW